MATNEISLQRATDASWRFYYELTKPKVVLLIAFTALVGMLLSTSGPVFLPHLFFGLIGISLAAASGAALNHIIDQRMDALMERTSNRPLPSGQLDNPHAILFAIGLGVASMVILTLLVNPLTALLTFSALIGYAVIYTLFLKRSTPQNIVWGGLAGAAPPLLGWCAITGEVAIQPVLLVLIVFVWTPPHFWPLAIRRRREYARVDVPMLPVTHGVRFTKQQVFLYSLMLLAVSLLPFAIRMSGYLYLGGAVVLGLGFVYQAAMLMKTEGDKRAMKTFGYSILYLSLLFCFLLIDHYMVMAFPVLGA